MSIWNCVAACGDREFPFIMLSDPGSFVETMLGAAKVIAAAEGWPAGLYELWVLVPSDHAHAGAWRLQEATLECVPGGAWLGHSNASLT